MTGVGLSAQSLSFSPAGWMQLCYQVKGNINYLSASATLNYRLVYVLIRMSVLSKMIAFHMQSILLISSTSNKVWIAIVFLCGIILQFSSEICSVLLQNSINNSELNVGQGMVFKQAMCAIRSAKAIRLFSLESDVISLGTRIDSNSC